MSLLVIGTPIFALLLAGAVLTFVLFLTVPSVALHQVMFGGLENYALLAIPFFIFAGELMGAAGIADKLIVWVLALIGRVPGSLGVATVGASTLIGAISGASVATVAAVGKSLYPGLIRDGYGARFSSGLVSSSGAIDILIPPSIAMILYGAAAEQSIPKLFVAGILPGLLIALMMAAYVIVRALQMKIPTSGEFNLRPFHVHELSRRAGPVHAGLRARHHLFRIFVADRGRRLRLPLCDHCRPLRLSHHVLERRAGGCGALGDADRADPGDRRDRGLVLLDPHHQRFPAGAGRPGCRRCSSRRGCS